MGFFSKVTGAIKSNPLAGVMTAFNPSGVAGTIASGGLDIYSARQQNKANKAAASRANDFTDSQRIHAERYATDERVNQQQYNTGERLEAQKYNTKMSNTQWERGVNDMRIAGLNPMLAFMQGGASSPQSHGASSSAPTVKGGAATTYRAESQYKQAGITAMRLMNELKLTDSAVKLNTAKASTEDQRAFEIFVNNYLKKGAIKWWEGSSGTGKTQQKQDTFFNKMKESFQRFKQNPKKWRSEPPSWRKK